MSNSIVLYIQVRLYLSKPLIAPCEKKIVLHIQIQIVNGVILVSWRRENLQRQIDYGAQLGQTVISFAQMELANFYRNTMPVADYFDQRSMLVEVSCWKILMKYFNALSPSIFVKLTFIGKKVSVSEDLQTRTNVHSEFCSFLEVYFY